MKINFVIKIKYYVVFFIFSIAAISASHAKSHGMVVTSQYLASKVGQEILNKGGNAIDAAAAVGYALSVVEPCCGNLGGGGFMLIHLKDGNDIVINFREKAPINISANLFFDKKGGLILDSLKSRYLSVALPGTVLGLNTALKKYGTMSLKDVIFPSINLAKNGFILSTSDIAFIQSVWRLLLSQPNIVSIFTKNGKLLKAGERLVQKNLALTLQKISDNGSYAFYNGDIADSIVYESKKNGGVLTKKDFMDYTVEIQKPVRCGVVA